MSSRAAGVPLPAGGLARRLRVWGASEAELAAHYPCDDLLDPADDAYLRAVTVDAPAERTWPWLCQLRVAPYSYDLVDNRGRRSPRRLTPGLTGIAPGDRFNAVFLVDSVEPGRQITARTHPGPLARSVFGDVACSYRLVPDGAQRCRLVAKFVVRYPPTPVVGAAVRRLLPAGDLVMARKQLLTLARLAAVR